MCADRIILHLSLIDGVGPITVKKILALKQSGFDLKNLYQLKCVDLTSLFGLSAKIASKLYAGLQDKNELDQELALIEKHNCKFISVANEQYPQLLAHIYAPPPVLYFKGGDILHHTKKIAVVGARKAHGYGEKAIEKIVPELVQKEWVIVSGGAIGADTMAHRSTLRAQGKTIAVLGSGLLKPYPFSNRRMFDEIVDKGGALVSSFPLLAEAKPGNFPARNRIIAGLSLGCVVVQAAQKSGACITARCALDEGREVFAVPGPVDDELSVGCHALIRQGAVLTACADDILTELSQYSENNTLPCAAESTSGERQKQNKIFETNQLTSFAKPDDTNADNQDDTSVENLIVKCCKTPCSFDDIAVAVQVDLGQLHELLFNMQLAGKIQQNFAGMWEKV